MCVCVCVCVFVCVCLCVHTTCVGVPFLSLSLSLSLFLLPGYIDLLPPSPPSPGQQLHDSTDSNEEQVMIYRYLGAGEMEALTKKCLGFTV